VEPLDRSSRNLLRGTPVAVARSSSGGVAIPGRSVMSMNVLFGYILLELEVIVQ